MRKVFNHATMTFDAVFLKNSAIFLCNRDRLVKILQCERFGMTVAVLRLRDVLTYEAMGQMTVNTGCRCMVARFLPGIELRSHNVAVHARPGVFAKIGKTLPVIEGETAEAEHQSNQDSQKYRILIHTCF